MNGYGLSGIGYGLDSLGLGYGNYSSYDPYMSSMYGGGYGMYGGMGMGMYNPMYMAQMTAQIQAQMEENQLNHAGKMNSMMHQYELTAHNNSDKTLIEKIMTNGDVLYGIQNLRDKVREGDQDGIRREYTKLRNAILNTYSKEFAAKGTDINPTTTANRIIEDLYSTIVSAQGKQTAGLRQDIKHYGDGAAMNGFMQGFRPGHHQTYVDETLNYCFGEDIDQRTQKDRSQTVFKGLGHGARFVEKSALGGVAGATAAVGVMSLPKFFGASYKLPWKSLKWIGLVSGLAYAIGDIFWQKSSV